jgi:hypothetical protein
MSKIKNNHQPIRSNSAQLGIEAEQITREIIFPKENLRILPDIYPPWKSLPSYVNKEFAKLHWKNFNKFSAYDWENDCEKIHNPVQECLKEGFLFSFDFLCEKNKVLYMIDTKNKINIDKYIWVNQREIYTFNFFNNKYNVKVKILVVIKKGAKIFYKFYNWKEFRIPKNWSKNKTEYTVKISLKNNINISEFESLENTI